MADPGKGRGRGLLMALQKIMDSPPGTVDPSPASTPGPSVAPSVASAAPSEVSVASSLGGRGRLLAMMQMQQRPGGSGDTQFAPASDVRPAPGVTSAVPVKGVGRGRIMLETLAKAQSTTASSQESGGAPSEVSAMTDTFAETSITSTSAAKNKYFKEVKDSPPVKMHGTAGVPLEVTANYVFLNFKENSVFEYEVRFEPQQDHKNLRFKLLNEHNKYFKVKTFDGTTLYVPHMLPDEATQLVSTNPYDNSEVKISIIFRRPRKLSEMIHIYNVLFKNIMKDLKLVRFGRQHFNEQAARQIPQHKLEVWPGYVTAVDEREGGLMLMLDSTSRVLRTENVLTFIKDLVHKHPDWQKAVTEKLVGCSVMTTYNKKLFRIDSIEMTMNPRSTFKKNEGGDMVEISYVDYYKKNYGIDIMDWNQPMLISRETKRQPGTDKPTDFLICLVPELCQLTGLTDDQRSNFNLMKDVATFTRVTPNQRQAAFKKYIENVLENDTARERLAGWGLSIAPNTVSIPARTLPPETIHFGKNIRVDGKPTADWNMDITRNPVMMAVDVMNWAVIYSKKDQNVAAGFAETMIMCGKPMGIRVNQPEMVLLPTDRTDAYVNAIRKVVKSNIKLVVTICPSARDDRYSAIKKTCCVENALPSQVINARTLMNQQKRRAITQKILLQINCKLGGTLWGISIPCKTAMIVGIDSYHDPGRKRGSVCSFVASYNESMTQWYSRAVFQQRGQEIADCLKTCLIDSLKFYVRVNGRMPDRIIMYRDGVGDGQLNVIRNYEVPQMKVCFSTLEANYNPSLTYIVVQKRINTRIFGRSGNGFENPPPGTVVDNTINKRDWYDFLIVSQKVNQGTVTPTHYVVAYDDSGMKPDQCQRLTYKMCHLYYNWPGTVRVPAPCQYAHKLAYLVGENITQQPAEELCDKLFFL